MTDRAAEELRRAIRQIFRPLGQPPGLPGLVAAGQLPRAGRRQAERDGIAEADRLHQHPHLMIPVGPFGKDVQRQIELPRRLFRHKLHYLIFLPSR